MCTHSFVFSSWSKTCINCGIESYFVSLDKYNLFSAPLERGYDRSQRFRMKVDKLLGLHTGPNSFDPIWEYLDSRKLFLNNPFDIRQTIRRSKLKMKHYDSIRIFTDAFTTFRVPSNQPLVLKKNLVAQFNNLYHMWLQRKDQSFFSYDWILRYFLESLHSPLIVYLKPKTCRKRDIKYRAKLNNFEKMVELRVVAPQHSVL